MHVNKKSNRLRWISTAFTGAVVWHLGHMSTTEEAVIWPLFHCPFIFLWDFWKLRLTFKKQTPLLTFAPLFRYCTFFTFSKCLAFSFLFVIIHFPCLSISLLSQDFGSSYAFSVIFGSSGVPGSIRLRAVRPYLSFFQSVPTTASVIWRIIGGIPMIVSCLSAVTSSVWCFGNVAAISPYVTRRLTLEFLYPLHERSGLRVSDSSYCDV